MAINPENINIANPIDLNTASNISNTDYLIIGQGNEYKTIPYAVVYNSFVSGVTALINNLEDEVIKHIPQLLIPQQQQTARDNIDVYSKLEVDSAIATATKVFTKAVFEHTLTASDVANTIMTFALTHTPKMDEWEFLFIGSAPVSPVSYSVSGNTLSIDTSTIGYPMQAGRLLIFRYMY